MRIHKEGRGPILVTGVLVTLLVVGFAVLTGGYKNWHLAVYGMIALFMGWVLSFFRVPARDLKQLAGSVLCPADGKVVNIEEVHEPEYFNDKMLLVSVFMSPLNVHLNRYPIDGRVVYYKYHPGKYLFAWHPKSSTLNERTTVVLESDGGTKLLVRQIAGVLARRIVCYASEGQAVEQGAELGFIKFGSRVDVYLPLGSKILVHRDQRVRGGINFLAELPS